jgi:hypothetical protein
LKVSRRLSARVGDFFKPKPKTELTTPAKVDELSPKIEEPEAVAPLENLATEGAAEEVKETPAVKEEAKALKLSRRLSARVGDFFKHKPKTELTTPVKVDELSPKIDEPEAVAPLEKPATEGAAEEAKETPAIKEEDKALKISRLLSARVGDFFKSRPKTELNPMENPATEGPQLEEAVKPVEAAAPVVAVTA